MVILESYARAAGVSKSVASWWRGEPYFSKESKDRELQPNSPSDRAVHRPSVDDGRYNMSAQDLPRRDRHDVLREHDEVGELAGRDRAEDAVRERRVRGVARHSCNAMPRPGRRPRSQAQKM